MFSFETTFLYSIAFDTRGDVVGKGTSTIYTYIYIYLRYIINCIIYMHHKKIYVIRYNSN